jgi:hypothetical protein
MLQFHPTIAIDGAPPDLPGVLAANQVAFYESSVAQTLRFVLTCKTGQVLLREIMGGPGGNSLRIVPFLLKDARTVFSNEQAATPNGQPVRNPANGQPRLGPNNQPILGTGGGANVTIFYMPITWLVDTFQTKRIGNLLPDDVLVHEMLHGLRMMMGLMEPLSLSTTALNQRFNNTEEFFALMVGDIYVSDRDKKYNMNQPLRANISVPDSFKPLTGEDARSGKFYQQFRGLIDGFCKEMTGLTFGGGMGGLRDVDGAFNPVKDSCDAFDALRLKMYGGI